MSGDGGGVYLFLYSLCIDLFCTWEPPPPWREKEKEKEKESVHSFFSWRFIHSFIYANAPKDTSKDDARTHPPRAFCKESQTCQIKVCVRSALFRTRPRPLFLLFKLLPLHNNWDFPLSSVVEKLNADLHVAFYLSEKRDAMYTVRGWRVMQNK